MLAYTRVLALTCVLYALTGGLAQCHAGLIDFEDSAGYDVPIPTNHYPGLTFHNAVWIQAGATFHDGIGGLGVENGQLNNINNWAFPGVDSPIVVEFDSPVSEVWIDVFDVLERGAEIEAFDSNFVSVGTDGGFDLGNATLKVTGNDILRIELRQLMNNNANGDGIGFDNLNFTSAPEPSSFAMMGLGFVGLAGYGWIRRRRKPAA